MRYDLSVSIRSILLSQLREKQKLAKTQSLIRYADKEELRRCIPQLGHFLMTHDIKVARLCVKVLLQIYNRNAESVASCITLEHVSTLFRSGMDDNSGGEFLWRVLSWKSLLPHYPFTEGTKLLQLLLLRMDVKEIKYIPCGALRWWLVLMWRDFPPMRPKDEPLVPLLTHWLATSKEPLKYKVPLLQVLNEEIRQMAPDRATARVLTTFFDVLPLATYHLQFVFHFLDLDCVSALLPDMLRRFDANRLLTFWTLILSWTPVAVPPRMQNQLQEPIQLFFDMLMIIMHAYATKKDAALMETCIRQVAAISTIEENAPFGITLLSLLRVEFPKSSLWRLSLSSFLQKLWRRHGNNPTLFKAFYQLGFEMHMPAQVPFEEPMFPMMEEALLAPMMPVDMPPSNVTRLVPGQARVGLANPVLGVRNFGNTCYCGSIIQSLFHTNQLMSSLFEFQLAPKPNPNPMDEEDYVIGVKILNAFQKLFGTMLLTQQDHVGIDGVIPELPPAIYVPNEQQDVTETLRYVFDKLGGHDQVLIRRLFTIELKENVQCGNCGYRRGKQELLFDFTVTVPPENSPEAMQGVSIQGLLNNHFQMHQMTGEDCLTCESCQRKTSALKWSEAVGAPSHLLISLQRMSFDPATLTITKDKTYVALDFILSFAGLEYELYFVIIHQGKGADSGHYVCLGRRSESDPQSWFYYDDSRAVPATYNEVCALSGPSKKDDSPYVLFYRCTSAPLSGLVSLPNDFVTYVQTHEGEH